MYSFFRSCTYLCGRLPTNSLIQLSVHKLEPVFLPNTHYTVCQVRLPDKLDVLFSFIKSHLKNKIIVFFATCSQVRMHCMMSTYVYRTFIYLPHCNLSQIRFTHIHVYSHTHTHTHTMN
jgi:hypothetical protein